LLLEEVFFLFDHKEHRVPFGKDSKSLALERPDAAYFIEREAQASREFLVKPEQ